jgi:uncharacterized protein
MTFFHGMQFSETPAGVALPLEKSMAVIGLLAIAGATAGAETAALDAAFPIDRPVIVTDVRAAIAKAGSTGTLKPALQAIAMLGSPIVVVVRAKTAANLEDQDDLLVGDNVDGLYTGMQAFRSAAVKPRIFGAPGLDSQEVIEGLVSVAQSLRGFVYASCRDAASETVEGAVTYRGQFDARELMLIWPDATGWDGKAIALALGRRAMLDEQVGWHQSISNVPVNGVTGTTKDVQFDMRDMSNDAGVLNAAHVTTIVNQGGGWRFWGNRTAAADPAYAFEVDTRTAQAIQDAIADAELRFVDKPMTVGLVRDIVETANAKLASWVIQGRLIGGECWFDGAENPASALNQGKLAIKFKYTRVAPLEGLGIQQIATDEYYLGFAAQLAG